ncbi:hypothetical protein E4U19_006771 [Claviceps sp. Clav32 group G5]|nr:hypothetical protein E4U19_006771 [Claviceps sp. Clav32 group G5]
MRVCDVVTAGSSYSTVEPTELTRDDSSNDTSARTCQSRRDADAGALPKIVDYLQKEQIRQPTRLPMRAGMPTPTRSFEPYMALEGYFVSCEHIRAIVSRAGRGSATPEDLVDFQRSLTERYHPDFVDETALTGSNFELRHGNDEPLIAYHSKVLSMLRRAGGRDRPTAGDNPLSPSENYILNDVIQRFIQSLTDRSLMQEAINQNVLEADSLRSAFERIKAG